jgi:hypothetical protein
MNAQERDDFARDEAYLQPILQRYVNLQELVEAELRRSTLPRLLEQLQYDTPPTTIDVMLSSVPDPRRAWIFTIAWALAYVGSGATYVMLARLTRRAKSHEAAWSEIAAELDAATTDVKQIYHLAVPILATIFRVRDIRPTWKEQAQVAA